MLEFGHIYFFYRPRVAALGEESWPQGLEDIARSYMVLDPKGREPFRLLVLPRKRLPNIARREREWAFVEAVSRTPDEIERELAEEVFETRTRGARMLPAARPAGEGVYTIVRHADHTHLAYALELPERRGPVQRALEIQREASYIVSVKNPQAPSPPEAGLPPQKAARYPKRLEQLFDGRRFAPADPPELLDYPGAQLLFIGACANLRSEIGIELDPQEENERTAEIFTELHLSKSRHPIDPLFKGQWR
jgi:hypothetical protein